MIANEGSVSVNDDLCVCQLLWSNGPCFRAVLFISSGTQSINSSCPVLRVGDPLVNRRGKVFWRSYANAEMQMIRK